MIHNTEKTPTTGTAVTIDELNTNGGVVFNGAATPYVKELNLLGNEGTNTNSSTTVLTTLKADVINIAAGVQENTETTAVELVASGAMTIMGEINADAVINNSGSVVCVNDFYSTINNKKAAAMAISGTIDFEGILNNEGYVYVIGNVEGTAGEVNNNEGGILTIQKSALRDDNGDIVGYTEGYFGFTATKLNINAKYTGIKVSSTIWPVNVTATSKKIYLNGDITFSASTALNGL